MKNIKTISILTASCLLLISCTLFRKSGNTILKGKIKGQFPDTVRIIIETKGIDSLLVVKNKEFMIELPCDSTTIGEVHCGNESLKFVPDGSVLNVVFNNNSKSFIRSFCLLKRGVHNKFVKYNDWCDNFEEKVDLALGKIQNDTSISYEEKVRRYEECYKKSLKDFVESNKRELKKHKDNVVAICVLKNIRHSLNYEELDSLICILDNKLKETELVKKLSTQVITLKNTREGAKFVDFKATLHQGKVNKEVKLSDFIGKGKYVLVDFWASWCGPCRKEIPTIKKVYEEFRSKNFDVVSVAVWDKPEDSIAAAKSLNVTWTELIDVQNIPGELYGITSIPHIMLIDPNGIILKRGLRGKEIREEVAKHLNKGE